MVIGSPPSPVTGSLEAALLDVLLSAETTREGASQLLRSITPAVEDMPCAIGARDRDGLTLHVLAEHGGPRPWPATLEPQFALGSQPGVDAATGAYVVPLRTQGRVVGALLLGDAPRAAALVRREDVAAVLVLTGAVLDALIRRAEAQVQRQALAWRSIDAIADGVAHEMMNPLTAASTLAELLHEQCEDEGERAALSRVRQELQRAMDVVADLQEFRRDTHAQDGLLDLTLITERVVRFRGYAIRGRGITLDVDCGSSYHPVRADIAALEHALHVVLDHAERESRGPVNRRIGVRVVERGGGEVAVHVTDSGAGRAPDLSPSCFDILHFPRMGRDEAERIPDLGFVASTLRGCGGRLEVLASKTEGTTLALVLPRASTGPTSPRRNSA